MKKGLLFLLVFVFCVALSGVSYAWNFDTHNDTVVNAMTFMQSASATSDQQFVANFLILNGGSTIASVMGQKCGNTDNFSDTKIGGWWVGYRTSVSIAGFSANYTAFWHFVTMFMPGRNGNAYDGYNYNNSEEDGFWGNNGLVKSLLYNQDCQNNGNAGNGQTTPDSPQGVRQAYQFKYQLSSTAKYYSTTPGGNYDDYQNIIFEPNTNAATYWYSKALNNQTSTAVNATHIATIGHTMHMAGDANVTQHVWDTLDNNHTDYESWVNSNRGTILNYTHVNDLIALFKSTYGITASAQMSNLTIQQLITFFAGRSVNIPGPIYSSDASVYSSAAYEEYNGSIALVALILEKYVNDLYVAAANRKF